MSVEAVEIRNRRRHKFAAPGGAHDRLVSFLAKALPAGIGLMAAIMILVPLSPRGEISFLLDRNKVAVTNERIRVHDAVYRGRDDKNRTFSINASNAVQQSAAVPVVQMLDLTAHLNLNDGPGNLRAPRGAYNYDKDTVTVDGPVYFDAPDGYTMRAHQAELDVKQNKATGTGGVVGTLNNGTYTADSMTADLENRVITLQGHARLRMTPGKLRIPQ